MKSHVVKVRATPDTGCTRTVISTAIAERLNLTPKTDQNILLVTANGEEMQVDGHAKLQASSRGTTVVTDAIISPHMNEDMLISWSDLIALNRIPAGFPNTIIRTDRESVRAARLECKQNIASASLRTSAAHRQARQTQTHQKTLFEHYAQKTKRKKAREIQTASRTDQHQTIQTHMEKRREIQLARRQDHPNKKRRQIQTIWANVQRKQLS